MGSGGWKGGRATKEQPPHVKQQQLLLRISFKVRVELNSTLFCVQTLSLYRAPWRWRNRGPKGNSLPQPPLAFPALPVGCLLYEHELSSSVWWFENPLGV